MPKRKRRKATVRKPKTSAAHMRHEREEERIFADFLRSIPAGRPTRAGPHIVVRKGRGWSIDGGPVMALMAAAAALHGRYKRNPRPEFAVYRQTQLPLYPPERFEEMGFPPGYEPVSRVSYGIPPEARAPYTLEELGIDEDTLPLDLPAEIFELLTPEAKQRLELNTEPYARREAYFAREAVSRVVGDKMAKDFSEEEWDRLSDEQRDLALENEQEFFEEIRKAIDEFAERESRSMSENADTDHIEQYFSEQAGQGNFRVSGWREVKDYLSTDFANFIEQNDMERNVDDAVDELLQEWQFWTFYGQYGRGVLTYEYDDNEYEFDFDNSWLPDNIADLLNQMKHSEEVAACYNYLDRKLRNGSLGTQWRKSDDEWDNWRLTIQYSEYAYADPNWGDVANALEETYFADAYNDWVDQQNGGEGTPALPGATARPSRMISAARVARAEVPHVFEFGDVRPDGSPRSEGFVGWYAVELQPGDLQDEADDFKGSLCFNNSSYKYKDQIRDGTAKMFSIRTPTHKSVFTLDVHTANLDCSSISRSGYSGSHSPDCPARRGTWHVSQIKGMGNRLPGMENGRLARPEEVEIAAQFIANFLQIDPATVNNMAQPLSMYDRYMQQERDRAAGILPKREVDYRFALSTMRSVAQDAPASDPPVITVPSDTTLMMVQGPRRTVLSWSAEKQAHGMRGAFVLKVSVQGQRGTEERIFALPDDASIWDYQHAIRPAMQKALLGEPLPPQMNPRRNPHCNPRRKRNPSVLTGATQSRPIGKVKPPKMTFWDFYEAQAKPRKARKRK